MTPMPVVPFAERDPDPDDGTLILAYDPDGQEWRGLFYNRPSTAAALKRYGFTHWCAAPDAPGSYRPEQEQPA